MEAPNSLRDSPRFKLYLPHIITLSWIVLFFLFIIFQPIDLELLETYPLILHNAVAGIILISCYFVYSAGIHVRKNEIQEFLTKVALYALFAPMILFACIGLKSEAAFNYMGFHFLCSVLAFYAGLIKKSE